MRFQNSSIYCNKKWISHCYKKRRHDFVQQSDRNVYAKFKVDCLSRFRTGARQVFRGLDKFALDADLACSGAQNHWDMPDFLGSQIFPCIKEEIHYIYKFLVLYVKQWKRCSEFQKQSWTSAYLNILIMLIYLMASTLLYLHMDWETFNWLHALEKVSGVIRAVEASKMILLTKTVSNVKGKLM